MTKFYRLGCRDFATTAPLSQTATARSRSWSFFTGSGSTTLLTGWLKSISIAHLLIFLCYNPSQIYRSCLRNPSAKHALYNSTSYLLVPVAPSLIYDRLSVQCVCCAQASSRWRPSACCWPTRSSTRRISFCCAATTSAPASTESTASTMSVRIFILSTVVLYFIFNGVDVNVRVFIRYGDADQVFCKSGSGRQ